MGRRFTIAVFTAIFAAMGVVMMVFAVAGLQTIQWCRENGTDVPWQAWAMLATAAAWCVIGANIPGKAWKDMGKLIDRLTEE